MPRPMENRDYGAEAHAAAELHLDACFEALWADDNEDGAEAESPAIGVFCGCQTCCVRETLHAAWPFMRQAALDGVE